jgi:hypothetical protein
MTDRGHSTFRSRLARVLENAKLVGMSSAPILRHEYEDEALMPDIAVCQTLEDYQNGVDSVMKYIMGEN